MARDSESVGRPQAFDFDTAEEFTLIVPAERLYEIFAVAFQWRASANAGNRTIQVRLSNRSGQPVFTRESQRIQVANEDINYVWSPGMPDETDVVPTNQILQPMPLITIGAGGRVVIDDDAGIDAADLLIGSISARIYTAGVEV